MSASIHSLLSAKAVRERAHMILARGLDGGLAHFAVHLDELPAAAAYVADTIQRNYPTLQVPPHARWRHFVVAGEDRWQTLAGNLEVSPNERARIRFDLAITSVLLDAGAGPDWRWRDPATGTMLARSEGLAIASLDAFRQGLFSSNANEPLRADAAGLRAVTPNGLCRVFQVAPDNPLLGLEGRVLLLQRLGDAVAADPRTFGAAGRLGALADRFVAMAGPGPGPVTADDVLNGVLRSFGTIWPGRIKLDGTELGDTWRHPAIEVDGPTRGLMPFHKLSQWLTYSLIEPLQESGLRIDCDALTGLAEYRNGGLFIDLGVIVPKRSEVLTMLHHPGDEAIVEWRALTVALLDEIAPLIRTRLGKTPAEMPLAAILEGGTWAAGRRISAERRPGGGPPIAVASDGSVF